MTARADRRNTVDEPDETRIFERLRLSFVRVGEMAVVHSVIEPGWRWSRDVGPQAGATRCQVFHRGIFISGTFRLEMADGSLIDLRPGDAYEIPPGHDAWVVGDEPVVMYDISVHMAEFGQPTASERVLATLLFTDIVGSTQLLRRHGDADWRRLMAAHDAAVRSEVERFHGRVVNTTGDGVLAAFDGAARGLLASLAIRSALQRLDLPIRIGLHTGEIEVIGADVRGVAVHAAARVMALAGAGEILVSDLTRQLAAGSGLMFEDRGQFEAKGFDEPMRLFTLKDRTGDL